MCNKLNLNLNIAGLFLQDTYTSTDTSWAGVRISFYVPHTERGSGRLGGNQVSEMMGFKSKWML